nr:hypothetical protein CFP56_76547 [Quercus suber]
MAPEAQRSAVAALLCIAADQGRLEVESKSSLQTSRRQTCFALVSLLRLLPPAQDKSLGCLSRMEQSSRSMSRKRILWPIMSPITVSTCMLCPNGSLASSARSVNCAHLCEDNDKRIYERISRAGRDET